jgi:hypothetical protein
MSTFALEIITITTPTGPAVDGLVNGKFRVLKRAGEGDDPGVGWKLKQRCEKLFSGTVTPASSDSPDDGGTLERCSKKIFLRKLG